MALQPLPSFSTALEGLFADPGDSEAAAAAKWADVIGAYSVAITPAVALPAHEAAMEAFEAALLGMAAPGAAVGTMSTAFGALAASLASAMAPPGVPPPAPLATTLTAAAGALYTEHADAADAWAAVIDAWFRTGTSSTGTPWA
jgi:hypothetical protein